nr:hypothetical protein [Tanacetum cinerariifolium]
MEDETEEDVVRRSKRAKAFDSQPSDGFHSDVDDHALELNRLRKPKQKASVGFDDEEMVDDKIADESMADVEPNNDNQHSFPEVEAEGSSVDIISTLPSGIIDTILCFVPIKDAVRTSTLSKNWRYSWVAIPKLVFHWRDMPDKTTYGLLDVAHQVLLRHQGPILEFGLTLKNAIDMSVGIDKIISHLVSNSSNTLKKLTVKVFIPFEEYDSDTPLYELPLSVFSLHQLTDLHARDCALIYHPTSSGFRSLTSLYLESNNMITISKEALLRFFSNCPHLKQLELVLGDEGIDEAITIIEVCKCLPVIEHMSFYRWTVEGSAQYSVRQKLPTELVHLKSFCLKMMNLFDDYGLRFVGLVMRNSPNLEKIKLEIIDDYYREDDVKLVTLGDFGDIWLDHLKEVEIVHFENVEGEMEFVELILAKSPVLEKLMIVSKKKVSDANICAAIAVFLAVDSLSRMEVLKQLHDVQSSNNRDIMQKAKIRWAIEGDENSKYFHAIINKKRVNLFVKGVMVDGDWIDDPDLVKQEFRSQFADRFQDPDSRRGSLNFLFPNCLSNNQILDLESPISKDEIRTAVWGCDVDKSSGETVLLSNSFASTRP